MHLITMAHLGEAQGVIKKFNLQKVKPQLFSGEDFWLVITGEGPFEATTITASTIPLAPFKGILNLGIAGALSEELSVGDIHPVRTIYLTYGDKPFFKTFQANLEGLDCITSFERILDSQKASSLKGLGKLVDREAWGVAMAAKSAGLPLRSYKLISDTAGSLGACELIKEKAEEYSEILANFLATVLMPEKMAEAREIKISGLYFTFTTQHRLQSLLEKISIKKNTTPDEVIDSLSLSLEMLRAEEITPKDRARKFIQILEEQIDPLKAHLESEKKKWTLPYEKAGIQIQTDPTWESESIKINLEVRSSEELKEKLKTLDSLSLEPFKNLMNGKVHVE